MVYHFRLSRNLKSLMVPAIAFAIIAGSLLIMVLHHVWLGIGALVVSGYIGYFLVKFFVNTLRSHVGTSDEGIVCSTATGSESRFRWDELSHAGWYTADSGSRDLFVYAEADDRLLTIPSIYQDMTGLEREIAERGNMKLLSLAGEEADGLADALRRYIVPESEIIDEESELNEDTE